MSSLPGGPADKAGMVHETLWGVFAMLDVLGGRADAIRIEEPGVNGAEFYLRREAVREHWQAKRQVIGQKTWSLQLLKAEGVLDFFLTTARAGEIGVFASISDAPELRVLAEHATEAHDWTEFREKFLSGGRHEHLRTLCRHWSGLPAEEAFGLLRRIRTKHASETTLEEILHCALQASFTGPAQAALAVLHRLYSTSVHRTFNAADIERHLAICGIQRRSVAISIGLQSRLESVTDGYIEGQRARLIRGESIPRQTAAEIVTQLTEAPHGRNVLIISLAGGGKSACMLQVVEGLRAKRMPVLAFRLDRVEPVGSTVALGEALELPESPGLVLSHAFPGQPSALVVDQLDFVSATSGRHPDFFDTVAALAQEVQGLRSGAPIHLILACRKFDFEHDHRLKRLLLPDEKPVSLGLLTDNEVKGVIESAGGNSNQLTPPQKELLRLPQNLSLFIEAGLAVEFQPGFVTQKELLDAYWETKRRSIASRRPSDAGQWLQAIGRLTSEMSRRQELSAPKTRLDEFSPGLLSAMVSEGVLTFDGRRYGFGHESLFDYCFARGVASGDGEFVESLERDEQELFRRAQLRQVLIYLRDDDFSRYLRNVRVALSSPKIRPHLKLLVLELIASLPEPSDQEFSVLLPYLEAELECRRQQRPNPHRIAERAWGAFFSSATLFPVADRLGYLERWLHSGVEAVENSMVYYLSRQLTDHANRVAELLEPFVGKDGEWPVRLRFIAESRNLDKDRRYFDLFLRLLDDGTLDDARDRFASNGTFWSMLYGLSKERPAWCAELAAHWLDRQVVRALAANKTELKEHPNLNDGFGEDDLHESASLAPNAFLEHVLPTILRAVRAYAWSDDDEVFPRDSIWPTRLYGADHGLGQAFLGGCEEAFRLLGDQEPYALRPFLDLLRPVRLYTANYLLLNAYLSAQDYFAEESMALLAAEPGRLSCGFSDSPYWVSRSLIERCSPHCSDEVFLALEVTLLSFVSAYERTREGFRWRGNAAFTLASALDPQRRSIAAERRLMEWERKYRKPDQPPRGIRSYSIVSPISEGAAEHMSDERWLEAITKHQNDRGRYDWKHPERGGASALAGLLRNSAEKEPERFARLALRFPDGTNTSYWANILYALKNAAIAAELKVEVSRRVFAFDDHACLTAALDLLGAIEDALLPENSLEFIHKMATENPSPPSDGDETRDPLSTGLNSVRGHAAGAVRDLIAHERAYLSRFETTLTCLVADRSLAVRTCVASTLLAVAFHDTPEAVRLFHELAGDADDRFLASHYAAEFLSRGLSKHFTELRPLIARMLRSSDEKVQETGGKLACLARLYHAAETDLAGAAVAGNLPLRLGAAAVAKSNSTKTNCREWCEATLQQLFHDPESAVRREAAGAFWHHWKEPEVPLTNYDRLIQTFIESPAFTEEPTYLLYALKDSRHRVPDTILDVCEVFVTKCAEKARDISTAIAGDERTVGELVFRAYAQLESSPHRSRALALIDRMCEEGLQSAGKHLGEFER